jgi:hypothetical protein
LPEQVAERLAILPRDRHGGIEQEAMPLPAEAVVELEVLVRLEAFVPAADSAKHRGRIGPEWHMVDDSRFRAVVVDRVPHAET